MRLASVAFFAGFFAVSAVAQAASVSTQSGRVFLNSGDGFTPVSDSTPAKPGAQVLVRDGGFAVISYGASCKVRVGVGRIWQIASKAPCTNGSTFIDMAALTGRQGAEGDAVPPPAEQVVGNAPPAPPPISPLLVGGLVVGGVAGIVVAVTSNNDDDPPASP